MKTKLYILLILLVAGSVNFGFAAEGPSAKESTLKEVVKVVKEKVNYPAFLKTEGVKKAGVVVEFMINESGEVNVINTNQSDLRVKNYVVKQIEEIVVRNQGYIEGEVYLLKFNFQLL